MNISLLQLNIKYGKPEQNKQEIISNLNKIPEGGVAVLPELFLTGYHDESIKKTAFSGELEGEISWLLDISEKKELLIYGSIAEREDKQVYNTGILVTEGEIVAKYRKSHLFTPMGEGKLFSPGREVVTREIKKMQVGLSICYDLRFPELYVEMKKRGVDIILISAEWPDTRIFHWDLLLKARAVENQAYVIGVNRVGKDPDYTYGGHSQVIDPFGEVVCMLDDQEGVCTTRINVQRISEFRELFDISRDRWL